MSNSSKSFGPLAAWFIAAGLVASIGDGGLGLCAVAIALYVLLKLTNRQASHKKTS